MKKPDVIASIQKRGVLLLALAMVVSNIVTVQAQQSQAPSKKLMDLLHFKTGEVNSATIQFDNIPRQCKYYVPKNFNLEAKHPLIIILHGFNQNIEATISWYETCKAKADVDGTILVYPISTGDGSKGTLAWNTRYGTYASTAFPETERVDDIGYVSYLIDAFTDTMHCDPDRVYITGTSLGGAFTYALTCYIPEKIAAAAPAIMQMGTKMLHDFPAVPSLPIMIINGSADPSVSDKGNNGDPSKDMLAYMSVVDNIAYWKARNGITAAAVVTELADPVVEQFKGQPMPSHIVKYVWENPKGFDMVWLNVINGGHWLPVWAGGAAIDAANKNGNDLSRLGNLNCDYDSAGAIYDFLLAHVRHH